MRLGRLDRVAPEAARTAPRKRWPRWLAWFAACLVALYILAPYAAIGIAASYLPRDLGDGMAITEVRSFAAVEPANLAMYIRPGRARLLARSAQGWWLPPWILRAGQNAGGTLAVQSETATVDLFWRAIISGGEPRPTLVMRFTTRQAAALLAPYSTIDLDPARGIALSYAVDRSEIRLEDRVEGAEPAWNLRVEASGRIGLTIAGIAEEVPVSRLLAHLRVRFAPDPHGWIPSAVLTIEAIDSPTTDMPMVTAPATRRQLEGMINVILKRRLARLTLPPWFPTDAVVEGHVAPDGLQE